MFPHDRPSSPHLLTLDFLPELWREIHLIVLFTVSSHAACWLGRSQVGAQGRPGQVGDKGEKGEHGRDNIGVKGHRGLPNRHPCRDKSDIVFLVDESGSVQDSELINHKAALFRFAEDFFRIEAGRIAIFSFSTDLFMTDGGKFLDTLPEVANHIRNIGSTRSGNPATATKLAISKAVQAIQARSFSAQNAVFFLITDGASAEGCFRTSNCVADAARPLKTIGYTVVVELVSRDANEVTIDDINKLKAVASTDSDFRHT